MLHLIHPALVHFAIAFLVAGGAVEGWALLARHERGTRFGGALSLAGTLTLVPTIAAGYLAANSAMLDGEALAALGRHERLGLTMLAVFLALALVKAWNRGRIAGAVRVPYAIALLASVALTILAALAGGRLVYGFGVGVAR